MSHLSSQLQLFLNPDADLGIKPEAYIRNLGGELQFSRRHTIPVRSLAAFEQSDEPEDWQQLMSRYMVRRTRGFIKNTYAKQDERGYYLEFPDGNKFHFPQRHPRTVRFSTSEVSDPYARLYGDRVVDIINHLNLPRYGLGNYVIQSPSSQKKQHRNRKSQGQMTLATGFEHLNLTEEEQRIVANLSQAGARLMGFCRTNLFKRLESSGAAFIQSIDRHILRNYVYLQAIANDLPIPIGTQDAALLDDTTDEDNDSLLSQDWETTTESGDGVDEEDLQPDLGFKQRAAAVYHLYRTQYLRRFKWIRPDLFQPKLAEHLEQDAQALLQILGLAGRWDAAADGKLKSLIRLLTEQHPEEKILIFTQFADTARYLAKALQTEKITQIGLVTGQTKDPTLLAQRFSPHSNDKNIAPEQQLRILIATDVLSEGQNLQDARIILNYDLPWAIIRLIQRAGRVDRIGQKSDQVLCYSFLPADGVEQLINLRGRLRDRLRQNQEVVGTDEAFFEDEEDEGEVDLTSEALQVWQTAIAANPKLKRMVEDLPDVVFSTRYHQPTVVEPEGILLYLRTAEGTDALAWVDKNGNSVTQSQMRILRMARCHLETPALDRHPQHYELVQKASELITEQTKKVAGTMGSKRGARIRVYDRLLAHCQRVKERTPILAQGLEWENLEKAIEMIHQYPLKQNAIARLNREFKAGIRDEDLARLVLFLQEHEALCVVTADGEFDGARVICSMGLFQG
jgi:hypothetical protein